MPTRGAKPEVNRVLRKLRSLGLLLEYSPGANHWRVIDPGTGAYLTSVSGTPSDVNWWHHIRRAVERAGFSWEGKARRRIKRPNPGEVSAIDLEALAHAQRMARLYGDREPQIEDLEDRGFLSRIRQGFNEQETEEAIKDMAHGVESARAHRVISRLLYMAEQHGDEWTARAKERNPKIRDNGVIHELMHVSQEVAKKRGLRYWKTRESAWQSLHNMLSGTSAGMTTWVANLLEATMDELDGLRYDPPATKPSEAVNGRIARAKAAAAERMAEAKQIILTSLTSDWQSRPDLAAALVPARLTQARFADALNELVQEGLVERDREKRYQGNYLFRLTGVAAPEPAQPEPEPAPTPAKPAPATRKAPAARKPPVISLEEAKAKIRGAVSSGWTPRGSFYKELVPKHMSASRFEDALSALIKEGATEWSYEPKKSGGRLYRLVPVPLFEPFHTEEPEAPSEAPAAKPPRSVLQAMTAGSIADRYADELFNILRRFAENGTQDWRSIEPILTRLDRLAGIQGEEV